MGELVSKPSQTVSRAEAVARNQSKVKVNVVYPIKDIRDGASISVDQIEERLITDNSEIPPDHIVSTAEAIGKVAHHLIPEGTLICYHQLSLPVKPKAGENWLFEFPDSELAKHLGKRITLKGRWLGSFQGLDAVETESGVIAYDGHGRVRIALPVGKVRPAPKSPVTRSDLQSAAAQKKYWLKKFSENDCVLASGILHRSTREKEAKPTASSKYFLLDQRTLELKKSIW